MHWANLRLPAFTWACCAGLSAEPGISDLQVLSAAWNCGDAGSGLVPCPPLVLIPPPALGSGKFLIPWAPMRGEYPSALSPPAPPTTPAPPSRSATPPHP